MNFKKYDGYGNGYKYHYEEKEAVDEIIITAILRIEKNSKAAMKRLAKADETNSSAILPIFQEYYRDLRKEIKK